MMPMEEALERLLSQVTSLGRTESVTTPLARGRVLAQDLDSPLDVPPYDNSAMDGYARRAAVPVFIEQRPHVVVHPPDPNGPRPVLENVFVDQCSATTRRRVDLGR